MANEAGRRRIQPPLAPQIAVERELFLRSVSVAQTLGPEAQMLARAMRDATFRAGETIFRAGDYTRLIHFVTHGEVELATIGAAPWRLEAPAILGVIDVTQQRPFSRTATAITEVRALVLSEEDWLETFEEHFEFARASLLGVAADLHRIHLSLPPSGGFVVPPATDGQEHEPHALNLQERTLALASVSCFQRATIQPLALLAMEAKEHALASGQRLFSRGEPARSIFVVARGTMRIEQDELNIQARFGPGTIVGGNAAIALITQAYTAEAETAATLLEIRREDLVDSLEDHTEMIRAVLFGLGAERELITVTDERGRSTLIPRSSART